MEPSKMAKLFGKNPVTGCTIFHEIAEARGMSLLRRTRDTVEETPYAALLREADCMGDLCTHVEVKSHRGLEAIKLLKVLFDMGADPNAVNEKMRFSLLHLIVVNNDYQLAKWLLSQPNVEVDLKGYDGLTPYEMAFIKMDNRMMNILRACGAQAVDTDPSSTSPWEQEM